MPDPSGPAQPPGRRILGIAHPCVISVRSRGLHFHSLVAGDPLWCLRQVPDQYHRDMDPEAILAGQSPSARDGHGDDRQRRHRRGRRHGWGRGLAAARPAIAFSSTRGCLAPREVPADEEHRIGVLRTLHVQQEGDLTRLRSGESPAPGPGRAEVTGGRALRDVPRIADGMENVRLTGVPMPSVTESTHQPD